MPLTICAIGNSHLASCKLGWRLICGEYPNIEIVFFGAPADSLADLRVDGKRLLPTTEALREKLAFTSRGKGEIDGDYDRYLLWGLDARMAAAVRACLADLSQDADDRDLVAGLRKYLSASVAIGLFAKLRAVTGAPIGLVPVPMPSESRTQETLRDVARTDDARRFAGLFRMSVTQMGREMGFQPFFQPDETLANPLNTKAIYSLAKPTPSGNRDVHHMNGGYGAAILNVCLHSHDFIGGD